MSMQRILALILVLMSVVSVLGAKQLSVGILSSPLLLSRGDFQETGKSQTTRAATQGWQGIVPLTSTRADVERLLGQPKSSIGEIYTYRTPDNRIDVSYSSEPCSDASPQGTASDVVLKITVSPQQTVRISTLGLDRDKYVRIQHDHPENLVEYLNASEGITIEAALKNACEEVISFIYRPTSRHREVRCG